MTKSLKNLFIAIRQHFNENKLQDIILCVVLVAIAGFAFHNIRLIIFSRSSGNNNQISMNPENGTSENDAPVRYAILIGVNDYQNHQGESLRPLNYCEADMIDLRSVLIGGGYSKQNIYMLLGPLATKANIEATIESVKKKSENKNSILLLCFSGHGRDHCLCGVDTDPTNSTTITETAFSLKCFLLDLKKDTKYQDLTVFCLVDACRTQPYNHSSNFDLGDPSEFNRDNTILFSACKPGTVSQEKPELGHGLFFHNVILSLTQNSPARTGGKIDFAPLRNNVTKGMEVYQNNAIQKFQTEGMKSTSSFVKQVTEEKKTSFQIPVVLTENASPPPVVEFEKTLKIEEFPKLKRDFILNLILLPSINEASWYADEMPWYLPCIRYAVVQKMALDETNENFSINTPPPYLNTSTEEVQKWLSAEAEKCLLPQADETLLQAMLRFTKEHKSIDEQVKTLEDTLKQYREDVNKEPDMHDHYPIREAIILHTEAVLQHKIRQIKVQDNHQENNLYETALCAYRYIKGDTQEDRLDLATRAFMLLCKADLARYDYLTKKKTGQQFEAFEKLANELCGFNDNEIAPASSKSDLFVPLFFVDFLTSFAFLYGESGRPAERYFSFAEIVAASRLPPNHPLCASVLERKGWYLMDHFRIGEAKTNFVKAKLIRTQLKDNSPQDPLALLFVNYNDHAMNTCKRFESNDISERKRIAYRFEQIAQEADEIRHRYGEFSSYRFGFRSYSRIAQSFERAGDCFWFDSEGTDKYQDAKKQYQNAMDFYKKDPLRNDEYLFVASKYFMVCLQLFSQNPEDIKDEFIRLIISEYDNIHANQTLGYMESHPKVFVRIVNEIMMKLKLKLIVKNNLNGHFLYSIDFFKTLDFYLDNALKDPDNMQFNLRDNYELYLLMSRILLENDTERSLENVMYLDALLSRFSDMPEVYPYLKAYCELAVKNIEELKKRDEFSPFSKVFEQKKSLYEKMIK